MSIVDLVQTGFVSLLVLMGRGDVLMPRFMTWSLQKMRASVGHTGVDEIRLLKVR